MLHGWCVANFQKQALSDYISKIGGINNLNLSLPHSRTDIINEKYDSSNHSQLPGAPKLPNAPDSPGGPSLHGPNPVPSYQPIEMQNEPKLQSANHTANPITIDSIQQQFGEIGSKIGNVFQAVKSSGFNCFNLKFIAKLNFTTTSPAGATIIWFE